MATIYFLVNVFIKGLPVTIISYARISSVKYYSLPYWCY